MKNEFPSTSSFTITSSPRGMLWPSPFVTPMIRYVIASWIASGLMTHAKHIVLQSHKDHKAHLVSELAGAFVQQFRETATSGDTVFYFHVFFREMPRVIRALPCDIIYASAESAEHINGIIKRTMLRRTNFGGGKKAEGKENSSVHLQTARLVVSKQLLPNVDNIRMTKMKTEHRNGGILKET